MEMTMPTLAATSANFDTRRIWTACLDCYEIWKLTGQPIDVRVPKSTDAFAPSTNRSCDHCGSDEFTVTVLQHNKDWQKGDNSPDDPDEQEPISDLDEDDRNAFEIFCGYNSMDAHPLSERLDAFHESYQGFYESELIFINKFIRNHGILSAIPSGFRTYFHEDTAMRVVFLRDFWSMEGHIFKNR
jgi:hypothetical protein